MATYYLSSVNGDDATADGTKNLPYATLGAIPFTNGDLILVDSAHITSEIISGPDPVNGPPIQIVSIDWATGSGNADESYLFGATFAKYSGQNVNGAVACFGLVASNRTSGYWMNVGAPTANADIYLNDCELGSNQTNISFVGRQNTTTTYSTRIRAENIRINLSAGYKWAFIGEAKCEIHAASLISDPQTDGIIYPKGGYAEIDGLDISILTAGNLIDAVGNGRLILRNAPTPAGVGLYSTGSPAIDALAGVQIFYASPSGSQDVITAEGQASTSGAVYRNGGATLSDGSAISFVCVTTANAVSGVKSLEVPLDRQILDLSVARTVRAYFAQDGGVALTDQDVWIEVRYRRPSDGLGKLVSSRPAAPHLAGTSLPIDAASTWAGLTTPNPQYIDVQIPADVAGDAHAEIYLHVAAPSATVYVDPKVEVA